MTPAKKKTAAKTTTPAASELAAEFERARSEHQSDAFHRTVVETWGPGNGPHYSRPIPADEPTDIAHKRA